MIWYKQIHERSIQNNIIKKKFHSFCTGRLEIWACKMKKKYILCPHNFMCFPNGFVQEKIKCKKTSKKHFENLKLKNVENALESL